MRPEYKKLYDKAKELAHTHCQERISDRTTEFQVEQLILKGLNIRHPDELFIYSRKSIRKKALKFGRI